MLMILRSGAELSGPPFFLPTALVYQDTIASSPAPVLVSVSALAPMGSITLTFDAGGYDGITNVDVVTEFGTVALSNIVEVDATHATADCPREMLALIGDTVQVSVTDANGTSNLVDVVLDAPAGFSVVLLNSINPGSAGDDIEGLAVGMQIVHEDPTTESATDVVWDSDGELYLPSAPGGVYTVSYYVIDNTDGQASDFIEVATIVVPWESSQVDSIAPVEATSSVFGASENIIENVAPNDSQSVSADLISVIVEAIGAADFSSTTNQYLVALTESMAPGATLAAIAIYQVDSEELVSAQSDQQSTLTASVESSELLALVASASDAQDAVVALSESINADVLLLGTTSVVWVIPSKNRICSPIPESHLARFRRTGLPYDSDFIVPMIEGTMLTYGFNWGEMLLPGEQIIQSEWNIDNSAFNLVADTYFDHFALAKISGGIAGRTAHARNTITTTIDGETNKYSKRIHLRCIQG